MKSRTLWRKRVKRSIQVPVVDINGNVDWVLDAIEFEDGSLLRFVGEAQRDCIIEYIEKGK